MSRVELINIFEDTLSMCHRTRWLGSEVVILGAFGCGAFANPPKLVAKAMYAAIEAHIYDFETIELAIYCSPRDTSNYEAFAKELNQ